MTTLIDLIIDQYERSEKLWNNITSGNSSFRVEEKHFKKVERSALINQAKELEKQKLIKIKWVSGYINFDIEKVMYPLSNMDSFYKISKRTPKYEIVAQQLHIAMDYYSIIKSVWIRKYIASEVIGSLEKGKFFNSDEFKKMDLLYKCLVGIDKLEEPTYKRVFSKRTFKNSKIFENNLQTSVVNIAKKYNDSIENSMEDSDVLKQLYIEEYSQELYIKGSLLIELEGQKIDTGSYYYGTVLNAQTIKNANILDNSQIKTILTIENKANFVVEKYEEGKLIIFTHGYFSPLERVFLNRLKDTLSKQPVTYLHSGDMDYGGVCIFKYIRNRIFPEIKPFKMDVDTFDRYKYLGEKIEDETLEKLKKCEEPLLQDVISRIIETGLVIEQEAYL